MLHRFQAYALVMALSIGPANPVLAADSLRMVVTAAFTSDKGLAIYDEMAKYIAKKIGVETKVVGNLSYTESDLLLKQGIIQAGFICGLPYTRAAKNGEYKLLAMPVMSLKEGEYPDVPGYKKVPGKYFSYTIVRKDSSLKGWQALRGRSYAYNDQNSNSGYNMPRFKLVQLGAKGWEDWFAKIVVSGSHEESVRLVARGMVDASSVDSLVLDYMRSIKDPDALNVKVIEVLGYPKGAGAIPAVWSTRADPKLGEAVQKALLNMHKDKEGRRILAEAKITRFLPPDDKNYDDIRQMEEAARKAGFRDHRP